VVEPAALAAAAPAGLAVAVLLHRPAPHRRLDRVLDGGRGPALPPAVRRRLRAAPAPGPRPGRQPLAACLVLAAACLLVLPPLLGLPAAATAVTAGPGLLARLEPAQSRRRRERLRADLPLLLDLLAACLCGGASPTAAASAVAGAVGGPAGDRLAVVAAALGVGTAPADAWSALAGPEPADDPLGPAARALARAAEGGAPVADAVSRMAAAARARARQDGEAAARRAGVLAVAPLGLCFLPAFVLLGVVPVIAGLAGPVLSGL
jgi:hypothetical protein